MNRDTLSPEQRLALALLEEVITCLGGRALAKGGNGGTTPQTRRRRRAHERAVLQHEAEEYVRSTDRSQFFAFENVCDYLDLDVATTRRRLLTRVAA